MNKPSCNHEKSDNHIN